MTEPAVTLTDYALALEGVVLLYLLQRGTAQNRELQFWFSLFFASASLAALCGGTVHGFFHDEQTVGHAVIWSTTLLATGVAALSTWAIGAELIPSRRIGRWVIAAAFVQLVLYSAIVLVYTDAFSVVLAFNLPAVLFLLFALGISYRSNRHPALLVIACALVLSLVAALLQQLKVGLPSMYFDHNVLYHLFQTIVLYLFFLGGRRLSRTESGRLWASATISGG